MTRRRLAATWPWPALALATLATLWPLGLTNRVLAGIDALTYFTPYWAYRMAALRAGQWPFWDPYLFLGVPFLANPQAAVLYPLHWPLSWLDPAQALVWSALLHTWLAAAFAYLFGRRSLALTRLGAALAGLLFGLGGYALARVENINQLNALAWLPAMLWLYDETLAAAGTRQRLRAGAGLAVAIALALLAGHTQTAFLDLCGLALYAVLVMLTALVPLAPGGLPRRAALSSCSAQAGRPLQPRALPGRGRLALARLAPLAALVPAILLGAAQLLPTLELNQLGLRTGGLPYRQAVSFSLRPRLLAQSLLPPFGGHLSETFGSEGYAEFVGYLGVAGLVLAGLGVTSSLSRANHAPRAVAPAQTRGARSRPDGTDEIGAVTSAPTGQGAEVPWARVGLMGLAVAGLFLALGAYNPLYYLLWRLVPGFALFRAPARWLCLYAIGASGLAGLGLDSLLRPSPGPRGPAKPWLWMDLGRRPGGRRLAWSAALLLLIALLAVQQWPRWPVVGGWLVAGLACAGLWRLGREPRRRRMARGGLVALALAELWIGGRALPFTLATAPAAAQGLRAAPAALLSATADQPPAGRDRFLSMSDIRFDPGDLAELRSLEADRLPPEAVERFVRAAKQTEVVAPNLSLLWRLPAVDGYDGGVLPLASYVKLETLFLAPDRLSPDGRLREQLLQVPPDRLLDLTGTRFVITDKQNDLWAGDVYYDLEQGVRLAPGASLTLDLGDYPAFSATAVGIVSSLAGATGDDVPVARVRLAGAGDQAIELELRSRADTAWAQETPARSAPPVARRWPEWMGEGRDYLAVKEFAPGPACEPAPAPGRTCPFTPHTIEITALPGQGAELVVRGLSLIDRRTGAHQSVTLSQRGDLRRIYSGDVKIYERMASPGRAWLVHAAQVVTDDAAALAQLARPAFDPRSQVILTAGPAAALPLAAGPGGGDKVTTFAYESGHIRLRTSSMTPAVLVVADAWYPGWRAAVDGQAAPLLKANLMFRGIALPAGEHEVELDYQPRAWPVAAITSLGGLALLASVVILSWVLKPRVGA